MSWDAWVIAACYWAMPAIFGLLFVIFYSSEPDGKVGE
jgi:hypothetical protein